MAVGGWQSEGVSTAPRRRALAGDTGVPLHRQLSLASRQLYVVVVAGGVSGIVVVVGCAGGVTGAAIGFGPSPPVEGSGGAWPVAPVAGASLFDCGGCIISGGAF